MSRRYTILAGILLICACALVGFAVSTAHEVKRTHNERGGYIDACGELPGLVGDDC